MSFFQKARQHNAVHGHKVGIKRVLDEILGDDIYRAYEWLVEIAAGEASYTKPSRKLRPDDDATTAALIPAEEVKPTFGERLAALELLIKMRHGVPRQLVDVSVQEHRAPLDVGMLDDRELLELEQLLQRAEPVDNRTGEVVMIDAAAKKR